MRPFAQASVPFGVVRFILKDTMETSSALKNRLDALRPLGPDRIALLWPQWKAEDALFVYATNAVEGSTLTLGETVAVLEHGITVGGKLLSEHLDALNGQKAYTMMLDLARKRASIALETVLNLHRAVVGDVTYAGQLRDEPVYIRGSLHVPPNHVKVPRLVDEMLHATAKAFRPGTILCGLLRRCISTC